MLAGCGTTPGGESSAPENSNTWYTGEDYTLEREAGTNQLTFYWSSSSADYTKCDMWIWYPNADGRGYVFHPCAYGGKVVLNVPSDITQVGFIVRKNCSEPGGTSWGEATKDFESDRYAVIQGETTEIYLKAGDGGQYFSTDGGKTLEQKKEFTLASIVDDHKIQYYITPATRFTSLDQIKVSEGGRNLEIASLSSLNNEVIMGFIETKEALDPGKPYTVTLEGYEPKTAVPTGIFDSAAFVEAYAYDGDDLGAVIKDGKTVFKVWAPTASSVLLNLYDAGEGGTAKTLEMQKGEKGVWSAEADAGHGTYYTYTVTTGLGSSETVDPYAKAVGVNGNRGMVIDLASTDPEGFSDDKYYDGLDSYGDAVIWEVHVRDFSNRIEGSKYPGKYLAFTETGLKNESGQPVGVDHLKELGVTHIHFQPLYDYATVNEAGDGKEFNWGYDPKNYNAPEGSYSTDPNRGEVRVNELKQMVKAIHENGMGVVMDVVYNHTYALDSCLNRTVPYYYYRFDGKGNPSNGSGCGNETASERAMFRKYMVDSVSYWAKEYHIDGFRFDLMALHDVETMQAIEKALHAINPKAIIYGEGWTGGTTPLEGSRSANQQNIRQVKASEGSAGAVSVFNDAIRDGLKGSVFDAKDKGYINGKVNAETASKVAFGISGASEEVKSAAGWYVDNGQVINYMSCHDNNTLWDKLIASNGDESDEARLSMYRFGASVVMISKGTAFFLAGEEMLRTKQGDSNSYKSSDEINNIDWSVLKESSPEKEMSDFYAQLIRVRQGLKLGSADVRTTVGSDFSITAEYSRGGTKDAIAFVNPGDGAKTFSVPDGKWTVAMNGSEFPDADAEANVSVPGRGVCVLYNSTPGPD